MTKFALFGALALSIAACSDSGPAAAKNPPSLTIETPARSTVLGAAGAISVRGKATPGLDATKLASVSINGTPAQLAADGSFTAELQLEPGATLIHTEVVDDAGGKMQDTRAVIAGEQRKAGARIDDAMGLAISKASFTALGTAIGNTLVQTDFAPMLAPKNPMYASGLDANGNEDLLFFKLNVHDFNMTGAQLSLVPQPGGLHFSASLQGLSIPMMTRWAVIGVTNETSTEIVAQTVKISAATDVSVRNGKFDVKMNNEVVQLTGLQVRGNGLDSRILNLILSNKVGEYLVAQAIEQFMGPAIADALGNVGGKKQFKVADQTLELELMPTTAQFNSDGAELMFTSTLAVTSATGNTDFLYTPNRPLNLGAGNGFKLGLADDMLNQLLAGLAATNLLNQALPAPGGTFDSAALAPTLPPVLSATAQDGSLQIIVGDMMMTFKQGDAPVAKAALNLRLGLKITGMGNVLKAELGEPDVFVDVLNDFANSTGFRDSDLEALVKLVVTHKVDVIKTLISAVPLPSFAGVTLSNVTAASSNGYAVVSGQLK